MMDIEKLIERMNNHLQSLAAYSDPELAHTLEDAATALSTLQAENEKLRKELEWKDMVIELAQRKEREAKGELERVKQENKYSAHDVALILEDAFGGSCACNFNGNDEWLPEKCELLEACPDVVGVACWEQYLKWRGQKED